MDTESAQVTRSKISTNCHPELHVEGMTHRPTTFKNIWSITKYTFEKIFEQQLWNSRLNCSIVMGYFSDCFFPQLHTRFPTTLPHVVISCCLILFSSHFFPFYFVFIFFRTSLCSFFTLDGVIVYVGLSWRKLPSPPNKNSFAAKILRIQLFRPPFPLKKIRSLWQTEDEFVLWQFAGLMR